MTHVPSDFPEPHSGTEAVAFKVAIDAIMALRLAARVLLSLSLSACIFLKRIKSLCSIYRVLPQPDDGSPADIM